jgi:hypothetical protein
MMEGIFRDEIETREVDKFFCAEMGRQIHRYIKAMHGSLAALMKFEDGLKQLSVPEREKAIAAYIDLNRKVVERLDWRMLVARALGDYCDSFNYFKELLQDDSTVTYYVKRMKEKYLRFHEVFEQDGKFGIKDHAGNVVVLPKYDFLRTPYVYVDDFRTMPVIAQKGDKMGLVLPDGKDTVVAPFIYDDISLRDEEPWFECVCNGKTVLL